MIQKLEKYYPFFTFLFAIILYANTIPNSYNLDDELVTINHRTTSKGFQGISEIIHSYYYEDAMGYKYDYRPVTHITFAIEHQFFGDNPYVSHAINVLLYGILCVLIFYLSNKLLPDKSPWFGLMTAVLFAVHPIHTEVVASIKNRDEILSLLFGVLALLNVLSLKNNDSLIKHLCFWALTLCFYSLGILSKNSIMPFSFLIPLAIVFIKREKIYLPLIFLILSAFISGLFIDYPLFTQIKIVVFAAATLIFYYWISYGFPINFKEYVAKLKSKIQTLSENQLIYTFLIFYFILNVFGVVFKFDNFIEYAFMMLVLSNRSIMVENLAKGYLTVVVSTVFFALFLIVNKDYSILQLLLFFLKMNIFYFSIGKIPWFLIIIVVMLFKNLALTFNFLVQILFILTIVFGVLAEKYINNQSIRYLRVLTIVLSLILIVSAPRYSYITLFDIQSIELFEKENNENKLVNEIAENVDRPLLFVENPLIENFSNLNKLSASVNSIHFYLIKLIYPSKLSFYYGFDSIEIINKSKYSFYLKISFLFVIILLSIYLIFKNKKMEIYSIVFFLTSIFIYANYFVPVAGIVAERLVFTASLGFIWLTVLAMNNVVNQNFKLRTLVLCVIVVLSTYLVVKRNLLWKDKITLYSHDIKYLQNSAQANALLGYAYMADGEQTNNFEHASSLALPFLLNATKIYPNYLNWQFDLGRIYMILNKPKDAKVHFLNALNIDSSYTLSHEYLAQIYLDESNFKLALSEINELLKKEPNNIDVLFLKSKILTQLEDFESLITVNNSIISINPQIPEAYLNLAYAFIKSNNMEEAKLYIEKVEIIAPNHKDLPFLVKLMENQ